MNTIHDVIAMIPEDSTDEALFAIETITSFPADHAARLRVYPMNEFRLWVRLKGDSVVIEAEGRSPVVCSQGGFIDSLRREIYAIDEAITNGRYHQAPPREAITGDDRPNPPADMDIPVWDEESGQWYDAEY